MNGIYYHISFSPTPEVPTAPYSKITIPLVGYLVHIPNPKTHHTHTSRLDQFSCRGSIYKFGKRRFIGIVPPISLYMFLANEDKHLRLGLFGPSNLVGKCILWLQWNWRWSCSIWSTPSISISSCSDWCRGSQCLVVQKLRPKANGHLSGWTLWALAQIHDVIHHSTKNPINTHGKGLIWIDAKVGTKMTKKKTKIMYRWSKNHETHGHVCSKYTYSDASWRTNECLQFLLDSRLGVNKHCMRCVILDNAYADSSSLQKLAPTQEGRTAIYLWPSKHTTTPITCSPRTKKHQLAH